MDLPDGGDTFESLLAGGQLTKVNETPVIITGGS